MMDVSWLQDFATLASTGSFSRAASARNITQPAFSRRIRMLEDWVGVPLFNRSSQPVLLTKAGQQFLPAVEGILRSLDEGRRSALESGAREINTLRFAATRILSLSFFPGWLGSLGASMSLADINLISGGTTLCEKSIVKDESQFLLCHFRREMAPWRLSDDLYTSIPVGVDYLVPVARTDSDGRALYNLDANQEQAVPFLGYREPGGLGRIFRTVFDANKIRPKLDIVVESHVALLLAMALDGRGIAWVPDSMIKMEREKGLLTDAGGKHWWIEMEVRLFRPRSRLSKAAEEFWKLAVEHQQHNVRLEHGTSVTAGTPNGNLSRLPGRVYS